MDYCVRVASSDFKEIKAESLKLPEDATSEFRFNVDAQYRTGDYAWFVCIDQRDAIHLAKKWRGVAVAGPGSMTRL